MTRLTHNDIKDIPGMLKAYDDTLAAMTGSDLAGIACRAYGLERSVFMDVASCTRAGIIPITWGQGTIPGFTEAVRAIVEHIGFTAFVTQATDVAGFSEAVERESDVIVLSDDDDFQAIHLKAGISVHNSEATGKVFAVGLDMMASGLEGQAALVVGCGPVGQQAGFELLQLGAVLTVVDEDLEKAGSTAQVLEQQLKQTVNVVHDLQKALQQHQFILDATPAAGIMGAQHVAGDTLVAAPGVPLGLTPEALKATSGRLLHDTLQLGVAGMMAAVVKGVASKK